MNLSQHRASQPRLLRLNLPPELAKTTLAYAAGAAVIALLLAGLLTAAVARGSAPPTLKIGLVAPFEGEYRSSGYDVLFAVKLALQERNQGEGVAGYRVELVALNDFNNPATAAEQARALVADPDIMGVIGHLHPAATQAALPVYRAAQLAVVAPWSSNTAAFQPGSGLVSVAATREETEAILQDFLRGQGILAAATLGGPDAASGLPANADALVIDADAVTAGVILRNLPAQGIGLPRFGLADAADRQLPQVAGPAADGLIFVSPGPAAADLPAAANFAAQYQLLAGVPPSPRAILAYDAAQILLDSIEKTIQMQRKWYNSPLDREMVSNTISTIARHGISGPIAFDELGHRYQAPTWLYQISDSAYPGNGVTP